MMIKMSVNNIEINIKLSNLNVQSINHLNKNINNLKHILLENHLIQNKVDKLDQKKIAIEFSNLIKRKYNAEIEKVILFGSVVRGEASQDSDIDIFIIGKGDRFQLRRKLMVDVIKFLLKYGIYISIKTLSTDEVTNVNNTGFMKNISQEGVLIG
jgi:predicted nucleotidyltransferase